MKLQVEIELNVNTEEFSPTDHKSAAELKHAMTQLTQSVGWPILMRFLDNEIQKRMRQSFFQPVTKAGLSAQLSQEFLKGEGTGMASVQRIPELLISLCEPVLAKPETEEEPDQNEEQEEEGADK